jgi:putative transposase
MIYNRHSIRLKEYDYSQAGLYFVTICLQDRLCLFGKIEDEKMILNDVGLMIERQWTDLINRFDNVRLYNFVIMPNHFHAIIEIVVQENINMSLKKKTLGEIIGAFESIVTVEYIRGVKDNNWQPFNKRLWQRNYYEHIIRNEQSYNTIYNYIINNPTNWKNDKLYERNTSAIMPLL